MDFLHLQNLVRKPQLYATGSDVMWTDPHISRQLLQFHIDPDHDTASRSRAKIELTVRWILDRMPHRKMSILDMGCGPGLYAEKFAEYGHRVTGIDFSESSIAYARSVAARNNSPNSFVCGNYLEMDFSNRFDLVIMIYLDFCVLKPQERKIVLQNVHRALRPGGSFVFDVVNGRNIQEKVLKPSWEVSGQGFWRDGPYLVLNNGFHYPEARVLANQHIVIDQSEEIRTYLFWSTCYESEDLEPILEDACFHNLRKHGNVLPGIDPWSGENVDFYIAGK